jgi:LytS/YehU family sensor histidine kinase
MASLVMIMVISLIVCVLTISQFPSLENVVDIESQTKQILMFVAIIGLFIIFTSAWIGLHIIDALKQYKKENN